MVPVIRLFSKEKSMPVLKPVVVSQVRFLLPMVLVLTTPMVLNPLKGKRTEASVAVVPLGSMAWLPDFPYETRSLRLFTTSTDFMKLSLLMFQPSANDGNNPYLSVLAPKAE